MTCTCTCGWVVFPELPHAASSWPTVTSSPGLTRIEPAQVCQDHVGAVLLQREDQVVADDRAQPPAKP